MAKLVHIALGVVAGLCVACQGAEQSGTVTTGRGQELTSTGSECHEWKPCPSGTSSTRDAVGNPYCAPDPEAAPEPGPVPDPVPEPVPNSEPGPTPSPDPEPLPAPEPAPEPEAETYRCPSASWYSTNGEGLGFCLVTGIVLPVGAEPYCHWLSYGYIGFTWPESSNESYECPEGLVKGTNTFGLGFCILPIPELPSASDLTPYCHWLSTGTIGFHWTIGGTSST